MCVGRGGVRGCENEDVRMSMRMGVGRGWVLGEGVRMRMGVGRWCENEDGCWERGWERV